MTQGQPPAGNRRRNRGPVVMAVLIVAAAIALWLISGPGSGPSTDGNDTAPTSEEVSPGSGARETAPPSSAVVPSPPASTGAPSSGAPGVVSYDPERVMQSGETVVIDARSLPSDAPAVLQLAVPAPPAGTRTLAVRLIAEGREPLELSGVVSGEDRDRVRVEVAPGWLQPGRTLVEVRTAELSHLPLRRYAVEVR